MKPELKYGLFTGFGVCLWVLLEYFMGFHGERYETGKYSGYFSSIIPLIFYYLAIREQRSRQGGKLTFGQGIRTGLVASVIAAAIITSFMLVYNHYINPGWMELLMEKEKQKMISEGYTQIVIDRKLEELKSNNSDAMLILFGLPLTIGIGVIISAVISLFLRRGPQEPVSPA